MKNIAFELKKRVVWLICQPVVGRLAAFLFRDRLRHHGVTIHTDNSMVAPGVKARLAWGLYERAETDFVKEHLPIDLDVIELGSSLGVVSTHIAQRLDDSRSLICVEANPGLVDEVARNIRHNAPNRCFKVVNGAIDYSGAAEVPFRIESVHVDSRVCESTDDADAVPVRTLTLGRLLAEHRLDRYALVMDIEGAEQALLANDTEALRQCQFIIAELHNLECDTEQAGILAMVERIETELGFEQISRRGDVYAFGR